MWDANVDHMPAFGTSMVDKDMRVVPGKYAVDAAMRDGGSIRIRAIATDDQDRLHEHFRGLSQQSIYFRFMGFKRDLSAQDLKWLTELDFDDHVGLAATLPENGRERFIGVGRYLRRKDPHRAEVAFAVLDEYQRHGIGTILLEHLALIARESGVTELEANVLGDNRQMLEVLVHSGFKIRQRLDSGVVNLYYSTNKP
jgi:GNAT superfamily N-acetyltransferase